MVDITFPHGKHQSDYVLLANNGSGLFSLVSTTSTSIFNSLISGGVVRATSTEVGAALLDLPLPQEILESSALAEKKRTKRATTGKASRKRTA